MSQQIWSSPTATAQLGAAELFCPCHMFLRVTEHPLRQKDSKWVPAYSKLQHSQQHPEMLLRQSITEQSAVVRAVSNYLC